MQLSRTLTHLKSCLSHLVPICIAFRLPFNKSYHPNMKMLLRKVGLIDRMTGFYETEHILEANIAVRTYTSTKLFNIQWNSRLSKPMLREDATLTPEDVNNEPIVDMKYLGNELLAVGDRGSVFICNISHGGSPMYVPLIAIQNILNVLGLGLCMINAKIRLAVKIIFGV
jgi:hypothetical protein